MSGQSYFQLLGPMVFIAFSAGFALMSWYARDIRSLRCFSISYFIGSSAMIADFFRFAMDPVFASALLSLLYLATTVTFCAGLYTLYGRRVPWRDMAFAAATVFLVFSSVRFHFDSLVWTSWTINLGVAALFTHTQVSLLGELRRPMDRVLHGVVAASTALLLIRTAIVLWYAGETLTNDDYAGSILAVTLQMFISVAALAVAVVLFVMYGMEIVRRLTVTSETDPLTDVLNRRGFDARLAALADSGTHHVLVMADLDRFKAINDRFGHDVGDAVIKRFARILKGTARDSDLVIRWGGEEFLTVIANADTATGRLYAEAVRSVFADMAHEGLQGTSVTASFGIAEWRRGEAFADIGHRADRALYRAKREGRNRVCADIAEASPDAGETAAA